MAALSTTVVKGLKTKYPTSAIFQNTISSMMQDSILAIQNALLNGDLISYDPVYTEDETHWIGTFVQDWVDQATHDSYDARPEIAVERANLDSTFEVTRS